jgi:hypothetical protein
MQVKYFDSQILNDESLLDEQKALQRDFYNKVSFEGNTPVKAEIHNKGIVARVVYFNQDAKNSELINEHLKTYGHIEFEICNPFKENDFFCQLRFCFDQNGVLKSYWLYKGEKEWYWSEEIMYSPEGEKLEIVKTIYNEAGDTVKEIHYRGDGSFWFEFDEEDKF